VERARQFLRLGLRLAYAAVMDTGAAEMERPQELTGTGTLYRSDGTPLPGERRYSITLVPWYEPDRPLAVSSWVELRGREPLDLENEQLTIRLSDERQLAFRVTDVSETPPHRHTFIAQHWPSRGE
jgi:hypothetical protein